MAEDGPVTQPSLPRLLIRWLLLGVLAVMGAWSLAEISAARRHGREQLRRDQRAIAERLAYSLDHPLWDLDRADMERTVGYEAVDPKVQALLVYDEAGKLYLGRVRDPHGLLQDFDPKDPRQAAWLDGAEAPLALPIQMKGKPIGKAVVYVSGAPLDLQLRQLWLAWLQRLAGLMAAFAAIIVVVMRRTVTRPLASLLAWVSSVAPDRPAPPPPSGLSQEMQALVDAFLAMDQRMEGKNRQLAATAQSYRTLFEGMPVAAFLYDLETRRFITVNPAAAELLELPMEDLVGMSLTAFVPDELREAFVARLKSYQPDHETKTTQRIQTHRGRPLDVEVLGRYIELDGRGLRLVMLSDVTQDRAVQQALRKNEERFRSLIEDSSEALALLDRQGKVLFTSASLQVVSGYAPDERLGADAAGSLHPADREEVLQVFAQSLTEPGRLFHYQCRVLHKRGHYLWAAATLRNRLDDPSIQAVVLNFRDITAEHDALAALQASEHRFRALVENTQDIVVIYRPDGSLNYENPLAAGALMGYSPAELKAFGAFELVHPEDVAKALHEVEMSLRTPLHLTQTELRLRCKNGDFKVFDARSINLVQDPAVGGILVQLRDISANREAQRQLLRFERLAAIGQTAAGLAHEVRNPLAILQTRAEFLKMQLVKDPAMQADLDSMLRQVERLRDLVNQVLESSRAEDLALKTVTADALLEAALSSAQTRYGQACEGIAVAKALGLPSPKVKVDVPQMERVLQNLILNALQAMGSHGELSLRAWQEGGQVLLSVADNGPGVPEAARAKVFEPFYTTKKTGSGLGLWICKNLVEQHGGQLSVEALQPRGTRFTVRLPALEGEAR